MNGLTQIEKTIKDFSAISFAEKKIKNCKEVHSDYEQYMKDLFGKSTSTLEECEQKAFVQYINEYKTCCAMYAGWIDNGKVFILDRLDKVVVFLYNRDDKHHRCYVHYNPFGEDVFEYITLTEYFFNNMGGRFEISKDAESLIEACDLLREKRN